MNLTGLLDHSRISFTKFWAQRDARERRLLLAAAALASLGLYIALLIYPALSGREQLNKNLPVLRQQIAQLQALSREAATLSERTVAPAIAMSRETIEAGLVRKGLKPQSVAVMGDITKVQLDTVSFSATLNWLDEMQKTALLSVTEANIVAQTQPDMINASFTLRRQGNE